MPGRAPYRVVGVYRDRPSTVRCPANFTLIKQIFTCNNVNVKIRLSKKKILSQALTLFFSMTSILIIRSFCSAINIFLFISNVSRSKMRMYVVAFCTSEIACHYFSTGPALSGARTGHRPIR